MSTLSTTTGTIFIVTIIVSPSDIGPFLKHLRPIYDAVRAEPDCYLFDVNVDPSQPGKFVFVEGWRKDKQWIVEVQLKKKYYEPYLEATEHMWLVPRTIEYYQKVDAFEYHESMDKIEWK